MLQYVLKNLDVPFAVIPNNMASLIDPLKESKAQIVFTQDVLPLHKIQHQHDPLVIFILINDNVIGRALVDNGFSFNVCSIELLHKINVDTSLIEPNSLTIYDFDNVAISYLGTITLPIKVRPIILPTPIHVMRNDLNYNILLG